LENNKIEILNLSCKIFNNIKIKGNKITSNGLNFLKESLIKNQFLKEIDFNSNNYKNKKDNKIDDEGCKILNEILLENKTIQNLFLNGKIQNNRRK
jgi:hypothetical protein